jgi:hypothetical protein
VKEIEKAVEGREFVSISTLKRGTGLDGRTIGKYLRDTGDWTRWSAGKTKRAVWKRKEAE